MQSLLVQLDFDYPYLLQCNASIASPVPACRQDKPAKTSLVDCVVAHKIDDELLLSGTGLSFVSRIS